jgi:hypothetical protein
MELSISDEKTKELLTEVLIDLMKNRRDVLHEIILEALEEVGLASAIEQGKSGDWVPEGEIRSILGAP